MEILASFDPHQRNLVSQKLANRGLKANQDDEENVDGNDSKTKDSDNDNDNDNDEKTLLQHQQK